MENENLMKVINNENGCWVKLRDLDNEHRTGIAAKILIKDGYLTLYTLLDEAPAINVYDSKHFAFISTDKEALLTLSTKGQIYDWWGEDTCQNHEDYTRSFLSTWNLDELEYENYLDLDEVNKLSELMISGLIQE